MAYKFLHTLIYLLLILKGFSQKETYNWYFPNKCALNFSTTTPVFLNTNTVTLGTGCGASLSDKNGQLLFYTDGSKVWNKQHVVMANGNSLQGNAFVEQAGLAVKQPGTNTNYYIFTNYPAGVTSGGFKYSVLDISLAAGLGSVTVLNIPLLTPGCEKAAATRHCNGTDVWIMTHEMNSTNFRAYLLTAAGLNTVPVISGSGNSYTTQSYGNGTLKFNPQGSYLADAQSEGPGFITLFSFDKATGIVSNSLNLGGSLYLSPLSTEFSSDGSKLYANTFDQTQPNSFPYVLQWDLCSGVPSGISASMNTIAVSTNSYAGFYSLQLAADEKIYLTRSYLSILSVIHSPNALGAACNFTDQAISTGTNLTKSLPGFESSLLKQKPTYTLVPNCSKVSFTPPQSCLPASAITGVQWMFGDPNSGATNTMITTNATHYFSAGGLYTVTAVVSHSSCAADTFKLELNVPATPQLTLTGRQTICKNESTTFSITNSASSYSWSNGSTSSSISLTPTITGVYSVSVTLTNSCLVTKSVTLTVNPCAAINELSDWDLQLNVYPNPHQNEFSIDVGEAIQAELFDFSGRLILSKKLEPGKNTLPVNETENGIYFLRLYTAEHSKTLRVVKE